MKRLLLLGMIMVGVLSACSGGTRSGSFLYIALGDSLSEGVGASDAEDNGFVPLVRDGLGADYELLNLGHSGDTSQDLLDHGHLDEAVEEIRARNGDDDEDSDVRLATLEIGGNDLLRLYYSLVLSGACPDLETALAKAECADALRQALDGFEPNLDTALDRLEEADPSLTIVLLTLYNPFAHLPVGKLSELSLEGKPGTPFPEGLNDIIRRVAEGRDNLTVVDLHPLFEGRTAELVSIDGIHPNNEGYQVMADAVLAAAEEKR